ncbi:long-chain fatty acid--CoA ligase [Sphingobium sp. BS19]|uniref:long-chain fatty acid--CoA ligase n=1 Tax=Sphingobium sp. BS19 TaxID=3018973 RepID=UPI0022EE9003|nr:long-chain fatty acid--CoA ligase [Sphingobium sp. BS19]GLJ00714.1 long-chain-fatty-acid--CoA ligase [Sphingobium sp. BS19]
MSTHKLGTPLPGLMQQTPLNIIDILRHAAVAHRSREIVSRLIDEPIWRTDYGHTADRVAQAANMLAKMGVRAGDRLSSLAWNTHRHFELFYAVPGIGAVLHTANPRLPEDHLIFTINNAGSRVLLFDSNLFEIVERIKPKLESIEYYIALTGHPLEAYPAYEEQISAEAKTFPWPLLDEDSAAFLCYTSGTTGNPKGVLYSHRSVVLHALAAGLSGALNMSAFDVIMPCQSLYHATAWGLPFVGALNGSKFVFPCDKFDGESLQTLIRDEGVTFSGGVPTIWTTYLDHLARTGETTGTLERVIIGGSAMPREMAKSFHALGVEVQQIWGMTETSPLGVVSTPTPALAALGKDAEQDGIWSRQGRMMFGVELKIVDDDGMALPHDGQVSGSLAVRGPWVIDRYYGADEPATDADGWFETGDIATIDEFGFMRITDRAKDVIKSGGEWISSIDLENAAAGCPGVKVAAVVGVQHPKWEERPILIVEPLEGALLDEHLVIEFLKTLVPRWWLPDIVLVSPIPLTGIGKIDKRKLRELHLDILMSD